MRSVNAAALAGTKPTLLPTITPAAFCRIERESCMWFNALGGKVFRDCSRSPAFHKWLAGRIEINLNENWSTKPDFVGNFSCSDLAFGSTPPLFSGARWIPTSAIECPRGFGKLGALLPVDLEHDTAVDTEVSFGPGGNFSFTLLTAVKVLKISIPLRVRIRLVELKGPARMGLREHSSFGSFLEDPACVFEVSQKNNYFYFGI